MSFSHLRRPALTVTLAPTFCSSWAELRSVSALPADRKARDTKAKEVLDAVKEDIQKAQVAAADIRTETLTVPAKLHRAILGPNGTTLNAVIGEDRLVAVKLGSSKAASADKAGGSALSDDSILVRGPSSEVERVVKELNRIAAEAEQTTSSTVTSPNSRSMPTTSLISSDAAARPSPSFARSSACASTLASLPALRVPTPQRRAARLLPPPRLCSPVARRTSRRPRSASRPKSRGWPTRRA